MSTWNYVSAQNYSYISTERGVDFLGFEIQFDDEEIHYNIYCNCSVYLEEQKVSWLDLTAEKVDEDGNVLTTEKNPAWCKATVESLLLEIAKEVPEWNRKKKSENAYKRMLKVG